MDCQPTWEYRPEDQWKAAKAKRSPLRTERDVSTVDGPSVRHQRQLKEAQRQKDVYERAKTELEVERRKKEAAGYAVMAAVYAFEPASKSKDLLGRMVYWSQIGCIFFAGCVPN